MGEDKLGNSAEEIFDLLLRATTGRVGSELIMGDD
jgi:hypothetical protein